MPLSLDTSIQYLKGVGEKRAALYRKLRIKSVRDLLYHFPRDYIDLSNPGEIMTSPLLEQCTVRARLLSKSGEQRIRAGLSLFKLTAADDSGTMDVTVFNTKYLVESLKLDAEYIFYGRMGGTLLRREMSAPSVFSVSDKNSILPVYPQTAGIQSGLIRRNVRQALEELAVLNDPLPSPLRERYGVNELMYSLKEIHFPDTLDSAYHARRRFVFEELLVLSCALSSLHRENVVRSVSPLSPVDLEPFTSSLPFSPTKAQFRCIEDSVKDFCSGIPMNRLIQGDVGSGKTLVAAACVYFMHQNGMQSAVMAPTSILAEQHFRTMTGFLQQFGIRCALLTGATKAADKREIYHQLEQGEVDLCIGTHALLTEHVQFAKLGLVVTDEQHRFGVAQRAGLSQKNSDTHVLVMSATPIPRTLSLIIYGDLQLSVIDELPPGRQPVETLVINGSKRQRAISFIRKALDTGRQAYIVCPLIEQGEIDMGLRPAKEYAEALAGHELAGYAVHLLHGRMKQAEKEDIMHRFQCGSIQVLVSTTVIEVGVDVPNATIMLIENAERFGLSQLHQLRGRVGRGSEKSYCILVSDARGEATRTRLRAMKETNDGFRIAEEDLKLRGPGDFFGYRQHGLPELKVADLMDDMEVLTTAQEAAQELLAQDPGMERPEHASLKKEVQRMLRAVGERPN